MTRPLRTIRNITLGDLAGLGVVILTAALACII